jgi:type IV fimbrial biogenesis protein FimT
MKRTPFSPARTARAQGRARQAGLSLIESLVGLAVTAVSLGAAVPGWEQAREQRHLEGTAAQLETDIHYARSLAVMHNRTLRISFQNDAAGSCYIVHTGSASACTCAADGATVCTSGNEAMRSVRLLQGGAVQLRANVRSIVFDPTKGTSTPTGTLRLVAPNDHAVHVVVNIMGRVRACTPTAAVHGYAAC